MRENRKHGLMREGRCEPVLYSTPHVFVDSGSEKPDAEEIAVAWEIRKQQERTEKGVESLLGDIPLALPALQRAHKIQSRMSRIGFDWDHAADVLTQLRDEIDELEEAMQQQNASACADELGDVLFSCVNLARHLRLDAEVCLRAGNNKVSGRIAWMEADVSAKGQSLAGNSLLELDVLWQAAKAALQLNGNSA